jgi:hypothetical protein
MYTSYEVESVIEAHYSGDSHLFLSQAIMTRHQLVNQVKKGNTIVIREKDGSICELDLDQIEKEVDLTFLGDLM